MFAGRRLLTLWEVESNMQDLANSVDPVEVAHYYEPPHLDLHCLPSCFSSQYDKPRTKLFFENLQTCFLSSTFWR